MLRCFVLFLIASQAQAQDWTGTWQGTLVNLPLKSGAKPVDVLLEIGPWPKADQQCTMWRTTYSEAGVVRQVKDYKLCRGNGASDLFFDENNGIKLPVQWLGDVLVTPFKYASQLLVTTTRLRGDTLEEEILSISDTPATTGVVALKATNLQRLTFKRK